MRNKETKKWMKKRGIKKMKMLISKSFKMNLLRGKNQMNSGYLDNMLTNFV